MALTKQRLHTIVWYLKTTFFFLFSESRTKNWPRAAKRRRKTLPWRVSYHNPFTICLMNFHISGWISTKALAIFSLNDSRTELKTLLLQTFISLSCSIWTPTLSSDVQHTRREVLRLSPVVWLASLTEWHHDTHIHFYSSLSHYQRLQCSDFLIHV